MTFTTIDSIIQHYSKKEDKQVTYDEQVREDSKVDDQQERQEGYIRKIPRNNDRFYPDSYHEDDHREEEE